MKAQIVERAPEHPIIDLFHDVPAHDVRAASVLLASHAVDFPYASVFVCVVDPGVGTDARLPGAVFAGGRWFVGPLNGLFEHVIRRFGDAKAYEITWRPERLSASFHGRDLFAPIAAEIAVGNMRNIAPLDLQEIRHEEFPDDVEEIVYADGFGNLMTGVRAASLGTDDVLSVAGRTLARHHTFDEGESGSLFCYENAVGLMEIAANRANARKILSIGPGTPIKIVKV
jgi:hypothetical protein